MRPTPDQMLGFLAQTVLADLAPGLEQDYEQRSAQIVGVLLTMLVEEWDRAAARLVDENDAVRAIFADADQVVTDEALQARLAEAAAAPDLDLRISALNAANDKLRGLLIDLHAHVEDLATDDAQTLETRIWTELKTSTDRRKLSLSPF